jgi:DNA repair protein RadC
MSIRDWPEAERPREKLLARGAHTLSEAELLAVLIGCGRKGHSAVELARALIADFGSLRQLLSADRTRWVREPDATRPAGLRRRAQGQMPPEGVRRCRLQGHMPPEGVRRRNRRGKRLPPEGFGLSRFPGIGPARYATMQAALELTRRHYCENLRVGPPMNAPEATRKFLVAQLRDRPYEVFCCLFLDVRHRLIAFEEMFRGTIDGATVHAREVVRFAMTHNSAAVIFAHNHPSGVTEPSHADELTTQRLREALALVDVRVLDHIIVGDGRCVSFAERGLL